MNMVTDTRRICSNIMDGDTNIDVPRFVTGNGICLVPLGGRIVQKQRGNGATRPVKPKMTNALQLCVDFCQLVKPSV